MTMYYSYFDKQTAIDKKVKTALKTLSYVMDENPFTVTVEDDIHCRFTSRGTTDNNIFLICEKEVGNAIREDIVRITSEIEVYHALIDSIRFLDYINLFYDDIDAYSSGVAYDLLYDLFSDYGRIRFLSKDRKDITFKDVNDILINAEKFILAAYNVDITDKLEDAHKALLDLDIIYTEASK